MMVIYILIIMMAIVLSGYQYLKDQQVHQVLKVLKVLKVDKELRVLEEQLVFHLELEWYLFNKMHLLDGQNLQHIMMLHLEL